MPDFWQTTEIEAFEKVIEDEVYNAVREFLTSDDPDTVLYWIHVPEASNDADALGLKVVVEGRGRENIERIFNFKALLEEDLDGRRGLDGKPALEPGDREYFQTMARGFKTLESTILAFLQRAEEVR